ncbi:MAG TPA: hypothetical protein VM695_10130 [Phycisphaerae bacterium]|nr:hypothetical protein [Phycisphaerae bacterium]
MGKEGKKGKQGKQAKKHLLEAIICPHCGKSFDQEFMRVVDTPGQPAEAHFEPCRGGESDSDHPGLFDEKEPQAQAQD